MEAPKRSKRSLGHLIHGHSAQEVFGTNKCSPTYVSWLSMHNRCRRADKSAECYRRKGITVCDRWSDFSLFLQDMGERPLGTTLDRIDSGGNYELGNCRWADSTTQARNRDGVSLTYARAVEAAAQRLCGDSYSKIAKDFGVSIRSIRSIVSGHSWQGAIDEAIAHYLKTHGSYPKYKGKLKRTLPPEEIQSRSERMRKQRMQWRLDGVPSWNKGIKQSIAAYRETK